MLDGFSPVCAFIWMIMDAGIVLAASDSSLGVQLGARKESKHFLPIVYMENLHSNIANALLRPHTDARKASS